MFIHNEQQEFRTKTILVVDDDQDTCDLLELLFRGRGHRVRSVTSGRQALFQVESEPPDLLLLDIMMPEMDGWETFRQVRQLTTAPVIFLTALCDGDCAARALSLGASDYIRKPFSSNELAARVQTLIQDENGRLRGGRVDGGKSGQEQGITVVIPAYNEARFIGSTVMEACEFAGRVIVVDDGSEDNTAALAEGAGATVVRHDFNQGKGAALNTGFRMARRVGAPVVVTLDADGQHRPEELAQLVQPILTGKADIVIGSRYLEKDPEKNRSLVPRHRILGHRVFTFLTNRMSGVNVSDSQSGYRAFSARALEAIEFYSNGFSVESEMQFLAHQNGLRVVEVPVTIQYPDRPKRSVIQHGLGVLNGILHLVGQYRPLLFFGLPGMVFLLFGVGWGIWVVEIFRRTKQLAVGYSLVSVLLSVIGLLLLSTGFTLHSIRGLLVDMLKGKYR